MDMIQTDKLVFEYDKQDEDGNIIGKSRQSMRWISM